MQLKIVPANDVFGALNLMTEVIDGKVAGFISPAEVNGIAPEVKGLPESVTNTALIVESSGSTGVPKRISLSLEALRFSAEASANQPLWCRKRCIRLKIEVDAPLLCAPKVPLGLCAL